MTSEAVRVSLPIAILQMMQPQSWQQIGGDRSQVKRCACQLSQLAQV